MTLALQMIGLLLAASGTLGMPYLSNFSPKMATVSEHPLRRTAVMMYVYTRRLHC